MSNSNFSFKKITINEHGYGMIDLLIGLTIIAVVVISSMIAFKQTTISSRNAVEQNKAIYFAQQKIEELKSYDGTGVWPPTLPETTVEVTGTTYTYKISDETSPTSNMKKYKVNVSWGDKSVELSTYIYL